MGDKAKIIELMKAINKAKGGNVIGFLSKMAPKSIPVIPTQSLILNKQLGIGGFPRGRIIEIYGVEGCGKSSIALGVVANAQKAGGVAVYIDMENTLDLEYARFLGVNTDELIVSNPDCGEDAFDIIESLARSNEVDVIVVDSVSALIPKAELLAEMEQQTIGLQARLMSKGLRKVTMALAKSKTMCIFLNQLREKVGSYGNPQTTSGGNALRFYAGVRIELRRGEFIKTDKDTIIGHTVRFHIEKNRFGPPYKKGEFKVLYDKGIDRMDEIITLAQEAGIIQRQGAWFTLYDNKYQGLMKLTAELESNPELYNQLEKDVCKFFNIPLEADLVSEVPPITTEELGDEQQEQSAG